jgi:signal transduction histidine kinase
MWRVVAVFRVLTLGYAAVVIIADDRRYAHPAAGLALLGAMAVWSVLTIAAYARPGGRSRWLVAADVAVASALIIATRWVDTPARIAQGAPTLPTFWAAASVLACAVAGGPWTGLAGAIVIAGADLAERQVLPRGTFNGTVFLVLIAGLVGGYVMRLGLRAEAAVDSAARSEAAAAERDRIARGIHDSVLQVLALVSRRGQELGGAAAELGRLAGEQERVLRSLVSGAAPSAPPGQLDLRALLEPYACERVTVSCPATAVLLADRTARALAAAAAEALDNVRHHAGPDARAWVLVDDDRSAVAVSVRDNGAGFGPGRLAQAAQAGRLGVAQSIMGRLRDAGGEAIVTSAPGQGTEVELRVPRN